MKWVWQLNLFSRTRVKPESAIFISFLVFFLTKRVFYRRNEIYPYSVTFQTNCIIPGRLMDFFKLSYIVMTTATLNLYKYLKKQRKKKKKKKKTQRNMIYYYYYFFLFCKGFIRLQSKEKSVRKLFCSI